MNVLNKTPLYLEQQQSSNQSESSNKGVAQWAKRQ